ncbi:hypothetical protein [Halorientalis regularis]|jgi:hypothetical protein|uniref:Uncharacterized protein n=1 Tax=Halorientalis regularis TaxID=660518 RepID=A0A1G7R378_9EURY|nr:hypothetical protein [Halorientalis regularis]SDG05222.1 hypothetical protein SAMN05216218_11428 [Halorientalis regularis]
MQGKTIVILLVLLAVLLPTWYVAAQGEPPSEEIEIDQSVNEIRPLAGFVDTPTKLSPSQVGVVVWVALFGLVGALAFFHRFMNRAARPDEGAEATVTETAADGREATDGGTVSLPWIETEDRWLVEYHPSSDAIEGLIAMGGLTALTIVFAALFTGEYLTLARTQYFGVYAFGMFMSLTGLTVSYYAWFMPHLKVAERRGH